MKSTLPFLVFIFSSSILFAQQEIKVEETTKPMSKGSQSGFVTEVPQAKLKDVTSGWKKYVKHDTKNSITEDNGDLIMKETMISNISPKPLYVYARFLETDMAVRLTAFFSEDDSTFISAQSSEDKSIAIKKFLRDFVVQQYKNAVYHELDAEKKKLAKLEGELDDLIKANDKANKRISENDRKIDKAKDDIAANRAEHEARATEVANQKEVVRGLSGTSGDVKDLAEKKLKDLEKEKKKLEKKGENLHGDADDYKSDTKQEERTIDKNEDAQKMKKDEITAQKVVVKNVENKVNKIK